MKTNDYEVIFAIVNEGYAEDVMDVARQQGAKGGTILNARGVAREEAAAFFGISLNIEKEIVMMVVPKDIKNDILKASQKEILNDYAHHGHEFFEMEFIIEGEGVYEIDGREYRIAPNTLFFMNPTNVHAIRAARASIINIMFTHDPKGDAADIGTLLLSQPPCFILDDQTNDFLRVVFSEIVRVYKRNAFL